MNKSSMIFKLMCMAVCFALCMSVVPAFAEDAAVVEENAAVEEIVEDVAAEEATEDAADEPAEEVSEPEDVEEEVEVVDLFTATLRDGGVYVTPGDQNAAVFDYDGLRYKVNAGMGNAIKLDGFESNPTIESEPLNDTAKNRLQANGEITTESAHSGYFGLSVYSGEVVYRTAVTLDQVYVFSAWMKLPNKGSFNEAGREFTVTSEAGDEYIVGYNEIGRDVSITGEWQQVLFTFKAPATGLFEIDFSYKGDVLYMDDLELYEAELFDNPLTIEEVICTDADGVEFTRDSGFSTSGTLTHKTVLYNADEDDVFFTAVAAVFKNDILIDLEYVNDRALVLDQTEVTFEIEIPEDEDLSQYKYMVYFIKDETPTHYYGEIPSRINPYVVKGN